MRQLRRNGQTPWSHKLPKLTSEEAEYLNSPTPITELGLPNAFHKAAPSPDGFTGELHQLLENHTGPSQFCEASVPLTSKPEKSKAL